MRQVGIGVQSAAAAAVVGATISLMLAAVVRVWGAAPFPAIVGISAMFGAFTVTPGLPRRAGLSIAALSLAFIAVAGCALPPGPALERWVFAFPVVLGAAAGAAVAYFKVELVRAPLPSVVLVLASALCLMAAPLAVGVAVGAIGTLLAGGPGAELRNYGARRSTFVWGGFLLAAAWWGAGLAVLLVERASLGPVPAFFVPVVAAIATGLALPIRRSWALAVAAVALCWAGVSLAGVVSDGRTLPMWGLALAGGILVRGWAPGHTALLVPLAASALALPLARSLPIAWQARGASAVSTTSGALAARLDRIRDGAEPHTSWSWTGASQWWEKGGLKLVELDGSVVGSSSRAAASERLAGTLAGCSARARGRVRVVGDDFGRVAEVVRGFGFEGIDMASPDRSIARAVADSDEAARATWLSADVRLLQVPPGALLGASGRASAVVEVIRVGWRDARTIWPDSSRLARHAAHVEDGGAHVLLLPGLGVDVAALRDTLRAFAAVWPVAAVYVPPEGAEELVVVGTAEPVTWDALSLCVRSAPWLRLAGLGSALELASLVIADHHAMAALAEGEAPSLGLPEAGEALPITSLFGADAESAHAFVGALPAELTARQSTRRAALQVLRASAGGDIRLALERARGLAAEAGAGVAIDPMVEPLLERARSVAARAALEGERSDLWAEADSVIEAALVMNPGSAAARCLRGDLAYSRRRADEALRWYSECAERDPQSSRAFQGVGAAQKALGRLPEAETALRESARLAPDDWATQLNLGSLLRQVGKLDEAERVLRRAEFLGSQTTDAGRSRTHLALARLYLQTSRAELALAEARRAELEEAGADSAFWSGAAQYELGAWAEAEASYRKALDRNGKLLDAREGLGLCLARRGDYRGAAEAFREVLAADPRRSVSREKLELLKPLLGAQAEAVRAAGNTP